MDAGRRFVKNRVKIAWRSAARPNEEDSHQPWRDGSRFDKTGDMTRILVALLGLLILSACVTQRSEPADQGLCESETAPNGKIGIVCH